MYSTVLQVFGPPCCRGEFFPLSEGAEKGVLVFIAQHVGHFDDRQRRIAQLLKRQLMTRFAQQALESLSFAGKLALQGTLTHCQFGRYGTDVGAPRRESPP
jgi:hypothetical protein